MCLEQRRNDIQENSQKTQPLTGIKFPSDAEASRNRGMPMATICPPTYWTDPWERFNPYEYLEIDQSVSMEVLADTIDMKLAMWHQAPEIHQAQGATEQQISEYYKLSQSIMKIKPFLLIPISRIFIDMACILDETQPHYTPTDEEMQQVPEDLRYLVQTHKAIHAKEGRERMLECLYVAYQTTISTSISKPEVQFSSAANAKAFDSPNP